MAKITPPNIFKRAVAFVLSVAIALPLFVSDGAAKENSVYAAEENVAYGDVNGDGFINILDMISLKSYLLENNTSHFSVKAADVDDDGTVSSKDIVELSMYLLDQIGSFSYEKNIDSDKDGLCDYIEKEVLGTDPLKADTDGDGLSDYAEIYYCDTDPLSVDTGNTGTKDCDKDADNDKLTNLEEIKLGTSPASVDTDEDGLSDYDELKKYKTDPLKEDTDGDKISDYGELKLDLDPLKSKTDGNTADTDRVFEQELNEKDELLSSFNSEESPFAVSVKTKSSGYLAESLDVRVSDYTNSLSSDSILGDIIDFDYYDDFKLEELQISFAINDEYTAENYMIFKYSEEMNMLFPIETEYTENSLIATDERDGTYCLVDLEKWTYSYSDIPTISPNTSNIHLAYDIISNTDSSKEIEIYYIIYSNSYFLDNVKSSIINATTSLIDYCNKNGKKIKLYLYSYGGLLQGGSENIYLDNKSSIEEIESKIAFVKSVPTSKLLLGKYPVLKSVDNIKNKFANLSDADKYCFIVNAGTVPPLNYTKTIEAPESMWDPNIVEWNQADLFDEERQYYFTGSEKIVEYTGNINETIESMHEELGMNFSLICNENNLKFERYKKNLLPTGKDVYILKDDFSDIVYNEVNGGNNSDIISYNVNTGICKDIPYDLSLLTLEWIEYYKDYYSSNLSKSERKKMIEELLKKGFPDTDGDGYPDCLEISMEYITFDANGNVILPTYSELAKDAWNRNGLDELVTMLKKRGKSIDNIRILPLKSNPVIDDSDSDGIPDNEDERPNKADIVTVDDSILDDSKIFESDYKTISNMKVSGYGFASSHTGEKKNNVIEYSRVLCNNNKIISKYCIEPDYNSDYLITVDTGIYDDCIIEVYYETGIFRKKKNSVSSVELDDGLKETEKTGSGMHYRKAYVLESGKKYQIKVTVKSTDYASKAYNVNFEKYNWLYAPYGGYVYYVYGYDDYLIDETEFYLTNNITYDIIKSSADYYPTSYPTLYSEFKSKSSDFRKCCNSAAQFFIECSSYKDVCDAKEDLDSLNNKIGIWASVSGVVLLAFPEISSFGLFVTVIGGETAVYSLFSNDSIQEEISRALFEGDFNISISKSTTLLHQTNNCNKWNGKYIRKYGDPLCKSNRYVNLKIFTYPVQHIEYNELI